MQTLRRLAGILTLVVFVGACSAAAPSSAPASTIPSGDPNSPVSTDLPPGGGSSGTPIDPGLVEPNPGQLDVHPVAIDTLSTTVDGRHVVVNVQWTSGVEPCNVLDSIVVERGDHAFTITIREGHGPEEVACIDIAQIKHATVDLGDLEPGAYTINDSQGRATPIEVTVG